MNILQIRSAFEDNGPGSQSLTIAKELRKRGHNVEFATSSGVMIPKFQESGFKVHVIDELARNRRDPLNVIRAVIALKHLIRMQKVDVIHGHNAAVIFVAYFAAKLAGLDVRLCHSVRGVELRAGYGWRNWIYRCYPAQMLAVCEFTRRKLIYDIGARAENIHISYNGVDIQRFNRDIHSAAKIRSAFSVPNDAVVIGHVGSMSQDAKGQDVLLRAFKKLYDRYGNLYVILVGGGIYLEKFQAEAKELGVMDRTIFAGQRFDIPDFQAAFDIFCLPSIRGEMFPNAILEAMAMGNPWVGSDISGLSEQTADGQAATVVPPGDVDALAIELECLVANSNLRSKRGEAALAEVHRKFTIELVVDRIEKVYALS